MRKKLLPLILCCALLLAGCAAEPSPAPTPTPTPSVSVEEPRPVPAVQIALIRDYMGPDCRGTDGGLLDGYGGTIRVQKLDLICDGETVTGTVEGVRAGFSDFESGCTYFRTGVRGVVGAAGGVPYVERLTYGDCQRGPGIHIQRVEEAITDENRRIVARRWYDQPVIYDPDSEGTEAVNEYFETECQTFMDDAEGFFWGSAEGLLELAGTDRFVDQNLRETVTTEVTYLDELLLSVNKTCNWFMAGTSPIHYAGDTFDLRSGQRLDLDYFVKVDIADFNDWVTDQVCAIAWEREEVEDCYSGLTFADYQYAYDGDSVIIFLEEPFVAGGAPVLRYKL